MKLRVKMENRGEIKKTQHIAKFRTATQMEERNMDLERRSERLKKIILKKAVLTKYLICMHV